MEILKGLESLLQSRTKRELMILNFFCFVLAFALVFTLGFERAWQELSRERNQQNALEQEMLTLETLLATTQNMPLKQLESLQKDIAILEQEVALQEQQKQLLNEKLGVYFLRDLAQANALHLIQISQSKSRISLALLGVFHNVLEFLNALQMQPQLQMQNVQLYPKGNALHLSLNVILKIP